MTRAVSSQEPGMRWRLAYTAIGVALGLGAPLGWLLLRLVTGHAPWISSEVSSHGTLYAYMAVGTSLAFAVSGYLLGRHDDRLEAHAKDISEALVDAKSQAITDGLTGLNNARELHDRLSAEVDLAIRYKTPLSCLMIDIDDFKKVNDDHGHPFGDAVLVSVAEAIRHCVRAVDVTGRLGGEEFIVIMRHTPPSAAFRVAERIRETVAATIVQLNGISAAVTVSIGLAAMPAGEINDKSDLMKATDDALYRAKRTGKNRTEIHGQANGMAGPPEKTKKT